MRVPAITWIVCFLSFPCVCGAQSSVFPYGADQPVSWFSTRGETIYHLKAARTDTGVDRSIVAASYSGKVLCFDFHGTNLWQVAAGQAFVFDLDVGDIDNDGLDECAAASADGSLYIIDHDGRLLAKVFDGGPPMYNVTTI